jgi:hypothetical protein
MKNHDESLPHIHAPYSITRVDIGDSVVTHSYLNKKVKYKLIGLGVCIGISTSITIMTTLVLLGLI